MIFVSSYGGGKPHFFKWIEIYSDPIAAYAFGWGNG